MKTNIHIPKIEGCARCGETHEGIWARPLSGEMPMMLTLRTIFVFTHFAVCPKTGEPILIAKDTFTRITPEQVKDYQDQLFPKE